MKKPPKQRLAETLVRRPPPTTEAARGPFLPRTPVRDAQHLPTGIRNGGGIIPGLPQNRPAATTPPRFSPQQQERRKIDAEIERIQRRQRKWDGRVAAEKHHHREAAGWS